MWLRIVLGCRDDGAALPCLPSCPCWSVWVRPSPYQCSVFFNLCNRYNILWWEKECWFIDVSQAVEPIHPSGLDFLFRLQFSWSIVSFHVLRLRYLTLCLQGLHKCLNILQQTWGWNSQPWGSVFPCQRPRDFTRWGKHHSQQRSPWHVTSQALRQRFWARSDDIRRMQLLKAQLALSTQREMILRWVWSTSSIAWLIMTHSMKQTWSIELDFSLWRGMCFHLVLSFCNHITHAQSHICLKIPMKL